MNRTRSVTFVPPEYASYKRDFSVGGTDDVYGPYLVNSDYQVMSDIVTQSFKKRVQRGDTIINPVDLVRTFRTSDTSGSISFVRKNSGGTIVEAYVGSGPTTIHIFGSYNFPKPAFSVDELEAEALLRAIANIDSTPLSSGEDIGELGETLRFLKSPLKGLFRELSRKGVSRIYDVPASMWLTLRFGVAPLVKSIHDILSEMKVPTAQPADIRVAHGRSEKADTVSGRYSLPNSLNGFHTASYENSKRVSCHSAIRYQLKKPLYDWRWRYGLRNKDLPATFWNLLPLSFMVDRVFDVSSMVKAGMNLADPDVVILGASTTIRNEVVNSYTHVNSSANTQYVTYSGSGPTVTDYTFRFTRKVVEPSFRHTVPGIKPSGLFEDFQKQTDLAALLRMFSRR